MAEDEVIERWTANRKAALVLDLLKGKRTLADACREYDLKQSKLEEWMECFVQGGTNRLKSRPYFRPLVIVALLNTGLNK